MDDLKKIQLLSFFIVSKELNEDIVFKNFKQLLNQLINSKKEEEVLLAYNLFISSLNNSKEKNLSRYLKEILYKNKSSSQFEKECEILSQITNVNYEKIKKIILEKFENLDKIINYLPEFENSEINFNEISKEEGLHTDVFSDYKAFIFDNDLEIKPVDFCESINFSNLKGYKNQKKVIYDNTASFLESKKVNNILLYGDAGCGKSSTVRALLNEFNNLKMIQVFKNNLINLDKLFNKLKDISYNFIIFADDISFDDNDSAFSTMKAVLEGSLIQCPKNAVIYATSNRRHLVKESFQSRTGDEIHLNDTINELNSLSERFGINLLFNKPTMEEYINIVLELAKDNNIDMDENCLIEKAKKTALIKGSTSPRVAKQLIDNILAYVNV